MTGAKPQNWNASRAVDARPLAELLPLTTPLSLMVDPTNACNFKCVFCPTGDAELLESVGRKKATLSLELFQKLVDDLQGFPEPLRVLHLYKDGEPLVNKRLPEMVRYAKASGRVTRVETTTNGSLLTEDRSHALIDAGIDGIRISVYAVDTPRYRSVTRTVVDFETVRANVAGLFALKSRLRPAVHVHCKIVDAGLSDDEKQRFADAFGAVCDSLHIDSIMGWSNTDLRDWTLGQQPARGMSGALLKTARKVCSEPFMKLAVNSNGTVSVCCVDWTHDTVVGDVKNESLPDIWNGPLLRELRRKHLTGRRDQISACGNCQYIRGLPAISDLDDEIDRLTAVYAESTPSVR
jgi:radical SAM protein with 4Fe4S-binding SPASM domain